MAIEWIATGKLYKKGEPINGIVINPNALERWTTTQLFSAGLRRRTAPAPSAGDLLAHAAARRYVVETAGCAYGGLAIATDRESQAKIIGAYVKAKANPNFTVQDWKLAPGVYVDTLSNATIIAIGDAVTDHVQACFSAERVVAAAILAGSITTFDQIDASAWPSNS